ncbi:hypothetical protein ANN_22096 [Periplaneta americana]|uniref:Uncharacterized protein n=1 Tax=Periplaneta americana TaxID=6978 RepID=A0ABQ8S854_PERAM|nr:hypothetical protein ANN_22096 [Periplaneta americana]
MESQKIEAKKGAHPDVCTMAQFFSSDISLPMEVDSVDSILFDEEDYISRSQNGTLCRHCRSEKETLAHILGACPHGELLRNSRHHQIRSLLESALPGKDYQVEEEVHGLSTNGSTRRIDLIAIPTRSTSGFIIDPTVRMETYENQPTEDALEGMVNGGRVRGRRRYQMIDDIKIYGSYEKTKRKEENRKDWRKLGLQSGKVLGRCLNTSAVRCPHRKNLVIILARRRRHVKKLSVRETSVSGLGEKSELCERWLCPAEAIPGAAERTDTARVSFSLDTMDMELEDEDVDVEAGFRTLFSTMDSSSIYVETVGDTD